MVFVNNGMDVLGEVDMLTPRLLDELNRLVEESHHLQQRVAACAERKRQLLLELRDRGWSLRTIASRTGLSAARVDQIIRSRKTPA